MGGDWKPGMQREIEVDRIIGGEVVFSGEWHNPVHHGFMTVDSDVELLQVGFKRTGKKKPDDRKKIEAKLKATLFRTGQIDTQWPWEWKSKDKGEADQQGISAVNTMCSSSGLLPVPEPKLILILKIVPLRGIITPFLKRVVFSVLHCLLYTAFWGRKCQF